MALTLAESRRLVEAERRECVAEREAFQRFRATVARAETGVETSVTGATPEFGTSQRLAGPTAMRAVSGSQAFARGASNTALREAYRQSVMAVGTPTEESVREHVAAELGPDLARVVCTESLTPDTRQALLDRIGLALDARDAFVTLLDRETQSLDAVAAACRRIREQLRHARSWEDASVSESRPSEAVLDAALSAWSRLDDLAADLDHVAEERQQTLVDHRRSVAAVDDVTDYLYGERPGLAAIASVGQELDVGRRAIARAVGRPRGR